MITEEQLDALHEAADALSEEQWDEVFRLARIGAGVLTIVGEYDLDLLGLAEDITIYDEGEPDRMRSVIIVTDEQVSILDELGTVLREAEIRALATRGGAQ